jgi:uncharacterized protein YuzE
MRITYDPRADAVYIRFKKESSTTQHWAEGIAADFDSEGRLVGIEILDASKMFEDLKALEHLSFEEFPVTSSSRPD